MIIDAHAHIFPDMISHKAVEGIHEFYNMNMECKGTVDDLIEEGGKAGVDRYIVQSVATVPKQVTSINNFIAKCVKKYPDKLVGFAAMHPDFEGNIEDELDRVTKLGLRGVKLHSDFQKFCIDDEKAFPIYKVCEERGLPILFHVGDSRYDYSSPERLFNIVKKFPKLVVIGAHFAGWSMWDRGAELFNHSGIYTDCSSSLYAMKPEHAVELIRKIGVHRVMWGTDYPMWSAKEELERFNRLPLTDRERELVLSENVRRLLGEL